MQDSCRTAVVYGFPFPAFAGTSFTGMTGTKKKRFLKLPKFEEEFNYEH